MMPTMRHLLASLKDDIGLSLLCQPSCHCQTRRSRTYDEIFCMYRSRHAFLLIWGEFIPFPPILVLQKITINLRKYKFSFSFHSPTPFQTISRPTHRWDSAIDTLTWDDSLRDAFQREIPRYRSVFPLPGTSLQ